MKYLIMSGLNDEDLIIIDRKNYLIIYVKKHNCSIKDDTKNILKYYKNSNKMGRVYFEIFVSGDTDRYDLVLKTDNEEELQKLLDFDYGFYINTIKDKRIKDKEKEVVYYNKSDKGQLRFQA